MVKNKSLQRATSQRPQAVQDQNGEQAVTGTNAWYCWELFGELLFDGITFKHGDPQLLPKNHPATKYLTYLDEE